MTAAGVLTVVAIIALGGYLADVTTSSGSKIRRASAVAPYAEVTAGFQKGLATLKWPPAANATGYTLARDGVVVATAGSGARSTQFSVTAGTHTLDAYPIFAPPPTTTVATTTTATTTAPTTTDATTTAETTPTPTTTAPTTTTNPAPPATGWAGDFACYGVQPSGSSCYTLAACTTTVTTSSGLQSAIAASAGGNVICLNGSGTFAAGTITQTPSSNVVIQPATGQTPTLTARFTGANHWDVKGVTINGGVTVAGSTNITIEHSTWVPGTQGILLCNNTSCGSTGGPANQNILIDYDDFTQTEAIQTESRITFYTHGASNPVGWTISHSLVAGTFSGQCSDGIDQVAGGGAGASGVVVGPGNEFTNINQGDCANGAHADPIAIQDTNGIVITSNYFHDNGSGSGGIFTWDQNGVVQNNVVLCTGGSATAEIGIRGSTDWSFKHNYIGANCDMAASDTDAPDGGTLTFINQVFDPAADYSCTTVGASCATSYMMNSGASGTGMVTENPVKLVSSPASGYYHYELDTTSAGYHSGSDGKSMGICDTCG